MESIVILFGAVIIGVFVFYSIQQKMDGKRIRAHIRSIGGELLGYETARTRGPWAGVPDVRVYGVRYRDKAERVHNLLAKIDYVNGDYFTEDVVISGDVDLTAIRADLHRK